MDALKLEAQRKQQVDDEQRPLPNRGSEKESGKTNNEPIKNDSDSKEFYLTSKNASGEQHLAFGAPDSSALGNHEIDSINYQPLISSRREIRLLQFVPGQVYSSSSRVVTETMVFKLSHAFLDDEPSFIALSYAWGDPNKKCSINVNGSIVDVTENLHSALLHLGSRLGELLFWVDALCINQSDDVEKSSQVQMMGSIYSQAVGVLVWLGPEEEGSNVAMQGLRDIPQSVQERGLLHAFEDFSVLDESYKLEKQSFVNGIVAKLETGKDIPFSEIAQLIRRAWWQRIWYALLRQ